MNLTNKKVLITGATGGIGNCLVKKFESLNTKITTKEFEQDNTIYNIFSSLREKVNAPARNRTNKD